MRNLFRNFSQQAKVYWKFSSNIRISEREISSLLEYFLQRAIVYWRFTSNIIINEREMRNLFRNFSQQAKVYWNFGNANSTSYPFGGYLQRLFKNYLFRPTKELYAERTCQETYFYLF